MNTGKDRTGQEQRLAVDRMNGMADPAVIEEITGHLGRTQNGAVKATVKNYLTVLREDPLLKDSISFNILLQRTEISRPLWWNAGPEPMTDAAENFLFLYFEQFYGMGNDRTMRKAIDVEAHDKQYHPILEYLEGLSWDGIPRIRFALKKYLGADDSDLVYECLKHFMMGAILRVYDPGIKFDEMLCLIGSQGAGKSTFFRFLSLKDEWFSDDIRKLNDKDVYGKLRGHWIIEMSEMVATLNAKSLEEIKSFLSRQKDVYRTPYARYDEDRPRQCVFAGTTNTVQFLPFDRTGARRFLPIEVGLHQPEKHILDDEEEAREYFDQMWAEAFWMFKESESRTQLLKIPKEIGAEIEANRRTFMQEDTRAGQVQAWLDDYEGDYVCSIQIWKEVFAGAYDDAPKKYETNEICSIMETSIAGWKRHGMHRFTKEGYGMQRSWIRLYSGKGAECVNEAGTDSFRKITDEEAEEVPFE